MGKALERVGWVGAAVLLLLWLCPSAVREYRGRQQLERDKYGTNCGSNLRHLGTCLEMYAVDNNGRFPPSLDRLVPRYLQLERRCP